MNDAVRVILPDGRTSSLRWDDAETGNLPGEQPRIITEEKVDGTIHAMPESWLRARVRGWMEITESPDKDWWIGTYTGEGKWIAASSGQDRYVPMQHRIEFARRVCKFVNLHCGHGGVWFAGWIRGGHEFYLLWKDPGGDITIPLEFPQPFTQLQGWTNDEIAEHCEQSHAIWVEWNKNLELSKSQEKAVAQGEAMSEEHYEVGPKVAGLE